MYMYKCIVKVNYEGSAVIALSDWGIYCMHMHFFPQVLNQTFEFFVDMVMDFAVCKFTFIEI